ncbi:hypothetical protein ABZ569_30430 [Streptomyces albus]|uniref:hypothetical protein n=1 Tax=Streptomyces albus TaxID=1888 RepID=UPI003406B5E5
MSTSTPATRYDKWLLKTMNDQRVKRYHATRGARLRIVAAHIAVTAAGLAGMVASYLTSSPWPLVVLLVALVAWIPLTGMLNSMTRGLLELRSHLLDERQLAERGTAHATAHRILFWLLTAELLGFWVAGVGYVPMADLAVPLAASLPLLWALHRLLPLWIAALRVRDEPEDDEWDEAAAGAPSAA